MITKEQASIAQVQRTEVAIKVVSDGMARKLAYHMASNRSKSYAEWVSEAKQTPYNTVIALIDTFESK